MKQEAVRMVALRSFGLVVLLGLVWQAQAQDPKRRIRVWPRLTNT